ncbi:MAG: NlpC/P60 family protein [Ilumatobacteraceae bacterium]
MTIRRSLRTIVGAGLLTVGFLAGPLVVHADTVDDAQRKVDQILDELDSLRDQMGQIDEDYGAALDRQDQLATEIAASQARIDDLTAQLGGVQSVMQQVALDRFTSGDSLSLSPIFSDASTYSAAGQRAALGLVAIDNGAGDMDDLQALVDDLADEQANLDRKQQEAAQLIATLEQKQKDFESLETTYLAKQAQATADLGAAKLQAAEDARAAAAAEQAQREQQNNNNNNSGGNTGGTGGGSSGGGSSGGGSSGGGSTPPPVSGKAGIAVSAAYSQLGVPYKFAAESPNVAFDCSGLTKWAWGRAGVYLPHQSAQQYGSTPHVSKDQAQPGDLIFYYSPIGHVGIYVGNGMMIHAPHTGDVVKLSTVHWNKVVGVSRPG